MPEFRFILGRQKDSNLVTNGDFGTGDLGNWSVTDSGNWSVTGGEARYSGGSCPTEISQSGLFSTGKIYQVEYDVRVDAAAAANTKHGVKIGDYGRQLEAINSTSFETFTVRRRCLSGSDLTIFLYVGNHGYTAIDNIKAYEMVTNDPIIDIPVGWNEQKLSIERDRALNGLFTKYISELTFHGDGYSAIKDELNSNGFGATKEIIIQMKVAETWKQIFNGIIYLSECKFDFNKCQVKCPVNDISGDQVVMRNIDKKVFFIPEVPTCPPTSNLGNYLLTDPTKSVDFHNVSTGNYDYTNRSAFNVNDIFRRIVHEISDVDVETESDLFGSGTFEHLCITFGNYLDSSGLNDAIKKLSFRDLFRNLRSIFALTFHAKTVNGVPTIKIEKEEDFLSGSSILTLNNVKNLKQEFDIEKLPTSMDVGYEKIDGLDPKTKSDGEAYQFDNGAEGNKRFVSSFVQDSQIIQDQLDGTTDEYDDDIFIVEVEMNADLDTKQFSMLYNGNIDADDNAQRLVNAFNSSATKLTDIKEEVTKSNTSFPSIYTFEVELSSSDFITLLESPADKITFNSPGNDISDTEAFLLNLEWDAVRGIANFKVIGE